VCFVAWQNQGNTSCVKTALGDIVVQIYVGKYPNYANSFSFFAPPRQLIAMHIGLMWHIVAHVKIATPHPASNASSAASLNSSDGKIEDTIYYRVFVRLPAGGVKTVSLQII
jgi:hypothetical protein